MNTKSTSASKSTRPAAKPAGRLQPKPSATAKTRSTAAKPAAPVAEPTPAGSKQSRLIAVLRTPAGGSIEQLTRLTGWQAHTVRGAISGALRKRLKLNITCVGSVYRIVEAQA